MSEMMQEGMADMPPVDEAVVTTAQDAMLVDVDGTQFDPELHSTGADGEPTVTKSGRWRNKRKSRSEGGDSSAPSIEHKAMGAVAANSIIQICVLTFGEEWVPLKDKELGLDERKVLVESWANYFASKDMDELPPSIVLSIAMLGYAAPRMTMPKTRSRLGKMKDWFASKLSKLRRKG